ncbi:MAG: hypothetical protein JL56_10275 [Desulfotomaculum sp. BICA1-6]|nr:MAG: hypothetical protein JL56_10275 [Desulfotomaculum sp. BICA1-6]
MKAFKPVIALALLICILASVAAGAGLFYHDQGSPFPFETIRGETVIIYGEGLYRYDTLFSAAGFKGQDAVTLFLGIPLLALVTLLYARGSARAHFLLTGILAFFLYAYASMALRASYNNLFLVYVALFSTSLFAFILSFSVNVQVFSQQVMSKLPRRFAAGYIFASGLVTFVVWSSQIVAALIEGRPPVLLESSSTMVTDALDLAIITPATFISGVLILRHNAWGYRILFPLLGIIIFLLPTIVISTKLQLLVGVTFSAGEIIGPISGFLILGLLAVILIIKIILTIPDSIECREKH